MKQEETTKEKASKKNKKNDLKPFVYPYDLRDGISQVSGGELYALHTPRSFRHFIRRLLMYRLLSLGG